jgi:hypothetical protein
MSSGPITRQYGVPNWDDIFGKKEEPPAGASPDHPSSNDQSKQEIERTKASKDAEQKE